MNTLTKIVEWLLCEQHYKYYEGSGIFLVLSVAAVITLTILLINNKTRKKFL